jgi:hypothetical protein
VEELKDRVVASALVKFDDVGCWYVAVRIKRELVCCAVLNIGSEEMVLLAEGLVLYAC